jgi:hypothetical protein
MRDLSEFFFFREVWFEPEGDSSPWLKLRRYRVMK